MTLISVNVRKTTTDLSIPHGNVFHVHVIVLVLNQLIAQHQLVLVNVAQVY